MGVLIVDEVKTLRLFLSYGRKDAAGLADRLRTDLEKLGYQVWQDTREIRAGREWEEQIVDGLRSTQVVIALLSPHAVRRAADPNNPDCLDSVCLDELTFARFATPPTPIVPIMAVPCEPPFPVFRLDYLSMTQWMQSEDHYRLGFERLVAGIEAAASGKPFPFRRWHHCLPVLDFASQLHEKRRDFVGRHWLFDEIDAWRTASSTERALLVVGDPGIGKSAFVAEMIHRNPDGQVLAYHICRADDPETLHSSTFVMSLAGMIAGRLPAFADLLEAPHYQDLFDPKTVSSRPQHVLDQGLLAALHQLPAPTDGVRYILIDALDEALTLGEGQLNIVTLLSTRLERFPSWLRIVATTRREPDVMNRLSGLRASSIDAHRQDNLDDIDRFIETRLQFPNLAERLAASRAPLAKVQHKLREKADGNFLYVSQALQDIERDNYSFSRLDELPQGLNQWYEAWFARKFPNPKLDFVDARSVLEVVLAAREPLAIELLREMIDLDPHYGVSEAANALSPLLVETSGRYSLYHKSLADWLLDIKSRHCVSRAQGYQKIHVYLRVEMEKTTCDWSRYTLNHALWHFAQLGGENGETSKSQSAKHGPVGNEWIILNGQRSFHKARFDAGANRYYIASDTGNSSGVLSQLDFNSRVWTQNFDSLLESSLGSIVALEYDTLVLEFPILTRDFEEIQSLVKTARLNGKGILIILNSTDAVTCENNILLGVPVITKSGVENDSKSTLATLIQYLAGN